MNFQGITFKKADGIGWVIVDRRDKMNTLSLEILQEIKTVFEGLPDDAEIRAVVLTGAGDKAFIAGADIGELAGLNAASGEQYAFAGQELTKIIENLGKPVIAAVNGYALGGGMELALACHIRLASENARMGLPEFKLGLIHGFGGTQKLARLVGKGKALELVPHRTYGRCRRSAGRGACQRSFFPGRIAPRHGETCPRNHCKRPPRT